MKASDIKHGDTFIFSDSEFTATQNAVVGETNTYVGVDVRVGGYHDDTLIIPNGADVILVSKGIDFGTGEESVEVDAQDLQPGVNVSGWKFGTHNSLIVQDVKHNGGMTHVYAVSTETAKMHDRWFHDHTKVETWGRI